MVHQIPSRRFLLDNKIWFKEFKMAVDTEHRKFEIDRREVEGKQTPFPRNKYYSL
jgi:hypothetical protein